MPTSPFQIFIAYSRQDTDFLEALRKHLRPLERSGKVKIWYDGKIEPGAVWEEAIKENLHAADLILLLVSADSIDSDYFYEKEVANALERHHRGEAKVVPLIVRPCVWKSTPLAELQALPKDGKAVSTWPDRDEAYSYSVEALLDMIDNIEEARRQEIERAKKAEADRLAAIHYKEAQARQQEADRLTAIQLAEQQEAQAELAARQKEEKRQKAAALAAQKKKDEAARQETAEQERLRTEADLRQKALDEQRKREAAAKRRRDNPSFFQKFYQQMIGASSILIFVAYLILRWSCRPEETVSKLLMPTGTDSTILGQDTSVGVRTISPSQLPPDVTVGGATTNRKSGFEMVPVKGGTFTMGQNNPDIGCKGCSENECAHSVTVGDFSIGKYEVTQADWEAVMGGFPKEQGNPNCGQCPVERISWNDIQDFLKKASAKYNKRFRLPTEAEWEYAARGGSRSKGFTHSGSNTVGSVAWNSKNSGGKTHPVGEKTANELGLHDMSGNVWEWCDELWKAYPNCKASECKNCRVLRGGSCGFEAPWLRPAYRLGLKPDDWDDVAGFRLAQD